MGVILQEDSVRG